MDIFTPQQIYSARAESLRNALGRMDTSTLRAIMKDIVSIASDERDPEAALRQVHAIVCDAIRETGRLRCV